MSSKMTIFAGSIFIALSALSAPPMASSALADCAPTDKINNTTAEDAVKAMEHAGYTQVRIRAKGCDNAWHATAMLNGAPVFVVWNAEGQVVTEGD
jgi:hypothetical protein